jgi:hypothetical protein
VDLPAGLGLAEVICGADFVGTGGAAAAWPIGTIVITDNAGYL